MREYISTYFNSFNCTAIIFYLNSLHTLTTLGYICTVYTDISRQFNRRIIKADDSVLLVYVLVIFCFLTFTRVSYFTYLP